MTDADLDQIERRLSITLPSAYRELMRTRASELNEITYEMWGKKRKWFDELLYLDHNRVIETNLAERQHDAGTEETFPGWSKMFLLIGSNGAGDYYCLRLAGDQKVWMIGSDCGVEPTEMYESLSDYVESGIRLHAETPPWQPPPPRSSFNDSCPLLERFQFFIRDRSVEIVCQEGDRPLTLDKLREHGWKVAELENGFLQVVASLTRLDSKGMTVEFDSQPGIYGSLNGTINRPSLIDPRFSAASAFIHGGDIFVSLYGRADEAPRPADVGIDWIAFRAAVADLLRCTHPVGTLVSVSEERTGGFNSNKQWNYNFKYSLE